MQMESGMQPYFEKNGITIYHADCRDILPTLEAGSVDLVLTDPPYGIGVQTAYKTRKRGALAECNDFPPVYDDDKPFDPSHLLSYPKVILFGANHYADRLPPSSSWLVWDKLSGLESKREFGFNDNADAELAWTNLPGPVRLIPHRWMGCMKQSEHGCRRVHPTQKPIALMEGIIRFFTREGALIVDPYIGSGPVLVASLRLNRRAIGIEIEERYCEIAAKRLEAEFSQLAPPSNHTTPSQKTPVVAS
jgi:site-specific DNA-methyltransferase (adenine-specific)